MGGFLVARIEGSPTNVIGLPLGETLELLAQAGVPLPWRAAMSEVAERLAQVRARVAAACARAGASPWSR